MHNKKENFVINLLSQTIEEKLSWELVNKNSFENILSQSEKVIRLFKTVIKANTVLVAETKYQVSEDGEEFFNKIGVEVYLINDQNLLKTHFSLEEVSEDLLLELLYNIDDKINKDILDIF